ncbi:MAG: UPF0104 family protein [Verrucomicrobia bacterium]|nr:UPF0104 family protein [Verrucomicrobiota bacterium]
MEKLIFKMLGSSVIPRSGSPQANFMKTHPYVSFFFRILFTVGALWFLTTKLNWQEFSAVVLEANPSWLVLAVAAYGGVVLVSIVRWHLLLEVAGAAVGWGRTAQLAVAGLFFNSILPGVMGGDVMRAFWAARDAPQARPAAVVSILLERVLGLAATVLLGAALILPRWTELNEHPVTHAGALAFVTVAGILLVILAVLVSPVSGRILAGDHSSGWRKAAAEGAKACHVCLTHPIGAGAGLLLSLTSQALLVALFFVVAEAMALPADFWQLASVLPMVAMVTVLPITWNGLGLREAAFVTFLGVYGVPAVQAVAISLTAFAVILLWNLLGGVVYLVTGVGRVDGVKGFRG